MLTHSVVAVSADVVGRYIKGERKNHIASEVGISRPTVNRILNAAGVEEKRKEALSVLAGGVVRVAEHYIENILQPDQVEAASDFLTRMKVLPAKEQAEALSGSIFIGLGELREPALVIDTAPIQPE